jgi:hypothetical protein
MSHGVDLLIASGSLKWGRSRETYESTSFSAADRWRAQPSLHTDPYFPPNLGTLVWIGLEGVFAGAAFLPRRGTAHRLCVSVRRCPPSSLHFGCFTPPKKIIREAGK